MLMILYIMWMQGFKLSVMMQPVWILLLFVLFKNHAGKKGLVVNIKKDSKMSPFLRAHKSIDLMVYTEY